VFAVNVQMHEFPVAGLFLHASLLLNFCSDHRESL
jgi:hypothetical protein